MRNRYLLLSILIVAIALAATCFLFGQLPERMPVHWDIHGNADSQGPRAMAFLMPAVMAGVLVLFGVLPRLSPQRFSVDAFSDTFWYCAMLLVGLLGFVQAIMLWGAIGQAAAALPRYLLAGIAVFTAMLGNVMGKVRRNFWIGVRTPWTLANERVWYSTHRLAAKTMVAASAIAFVSALAGRPAVSIWLVAAGAIVPAAYSLLYYKRLERSGGLGA
jgi:uncharacterized membrane protein